MSDGLKRENLLGIAFITLAMAAFAVEDSLIKLLSTRLSSGQILVMIGFGGTLIFYTWSHQRGDGLTGAMIRNPWVIGRTLSELVGTAFFSGCAHYHCLSHHSGQPAFGNLGRRCLAARESGAPALERDFCGSVRRCGDLKTLVYGF